MLADYLNQQATLQIMSDPDQYNDRTIVSTATIPCRRQNVFRIAQNAEGALFTAQTMYICDITQNVPRAWIDKLDGHLIVEVQEYVDGSGQTLGYEAYV